MQQTVEYRDNHRKKGTFRTWADFLGRFKQLKNKYLALAFSMALLGLLDNAAPIVVSKIIDEGIAKANLNAVLNYIVILVLVYLFICLNVWLFIKKAGEVEAGAAYAMRASCFKKLQSLELDYYNREETGKILSRITSDCSKVSLQMGWGIVDFIYGPLSMLTILLFMFYINYRLALILIATLPLFILFYFLTNKKLVSMNRRVRKKNSELIGLITEGINGAKTSKTLGIEEKNLGAYRQASSAMKSLSLRTRVFGALFQPYVIFVSALATALLLYFGSSDIMNGFMTFGELAVFLSYARFFLWPVQIIAELISELIASQAALERISELMDMEEGVRDSERVLELYGDFFEKKSENWEELRGDIEFRNVDFWYKEGETLLKNFSLKVERGMSVALVGETGAGKSTIVNLAARFYEPKAGQILIDGIDYKERSIAWLHSNMGYVLQSPHLFSGTVEDNIRYGRLDATAQEVREAAGIIGADEMILKLDKGYETEVGEGGALLSTGEKQLISFARAVLANPKIFFLDEATSSVDTMTELRIQEAIKTLLKGRTSFIIAHRLSTIRSADLILVIEGGGIAEMGSHAELMERRGRYYEYVQKQVT